MTGTISNQFDSLHTVEHSCVHANTDGTWFGYEYNNFGSIDNEHLSTDERQYARKWKTDGEWRLLFGEDGLLQLTGIEIITIEYLGVTREAVWDGAGYVIYDTILTDDSQLAYINCDRDFCIAIYFLPQLVIESDFKELTDESI